MTNGQDVPYPDVLDRMSEHFGSLGLRARVEQTLANAGKDATNTSVEELAALDQLHIEGLAATRRLAERAQIGADDLVLDAGCGMGGAARYLAKTYGCTVRGIDMTESYLETAQLLNELTGLTDRVFLERGDVTDIRFDDTSFDVVWTQHAAQSVPDKQALFAELYRVLKPGGRCVVHDLYKGPGDPIHFPSFCAPDESICFLVSDVEVMRLLDAVGFEALHWADKTEAARTANSGIGSEHATHEGQEQGIEGLDLFIVAGEETLVMARNSIKDFDVGSVGLFEALLRKP